jgi:hypothetical protein
MALVLALFAAPAASADWGYEQVSPFNKGGGTVTAGDTYTAAPDGESILYSAAGSFAEVPSQSLPAYTRYFAERGSDRWVNRATDPPYDMPSTGNEFGAQLAIMMTVRSSVNQRYSVVASARALTPGATEGGSNLYMRDNRTGELILMVTDPSYALFRLAITVQGQTKYAWVAPDGKAALFYALVELEGQPPCMQQWTEQDGLECVAEDTSLESVDMGETGTREPLPADDALSRLYLNTASGSPVYLRENGTLTPISVSQVSGDEGRVANAQVNAVSAGGRYAFFTTTEGPLTDDTPAVSAFHFVYRYDSSDDSLDYVGAGGEFGGIPQAIQASSDGSTLAFRSPGALTPGSEEAPAKSTNLYLWRNGQLRLIFKTDAGSDLGGGLAKAQAGLSRDGSYLYFTDNSASLASKYGTETTSLICAEPKAPAVALPCDQAYVYDADAGSGLGTLDCVSCVEGAVSGSSGDPGTGNSGYARYSNHAPQNVSIDGGVFFTTFEAFDPNDKNGLADVYEWRGGEHRLVSTAREGKTARFVDASEDGKTIFFTSTDAIVPQDSDRVLDLYMTREGAGFPYTPPPVTPPCLALESCHGGIPGVAPGPNPSTATFEGRPNPEIAVGRVTVTKAAAAGKAVRVTVRVSGPGRVTASGPGLRKASKRARKAGKVTLSLRLAPGSERALKTHSRVSRKVTVSFQPAEGRGATATKALTLKAPGKQEPAKRKGGN